MTQYVYAIQADGYGGDIKIGISRDPCARLRSLQTASALDLRGIAAWSALPFEERLIHEEYARVRIRGEWFMHNLPMYRYLRDRGGDFKWA